MRGIILTAGVLVAASILVATNTPSPAHLNNSTVSTEVQTATSKADEQLPNMQQPSPQTVKSVEPEKPQAQAKVAVQETKPKTAVEIVQYRAAQEGWNGEEWNSLNHLIQLESSWNTHAVNKSSGACGLFQSISCDYNMDDIHAQADWGIRYIKERYGSPSKAVHFWYNIAPSYFGSNWY
jgi:hypothetical protein